MKKSSPAITMSYGFKHAFVEIVPTEIPHNAQSPDP